MNRNTPLSCFAAAPLFFDRAGMEDCASALVRPLRGVFRMDARLRDHDYSHVACWQSSVGTRND